MYSCIESSCEAVVDLKIRVFSGKYNISMAQTTELTKLTYQPSHKRRWQISKLKPRQSCSYSNYSIVGGFLDVSIVFGENLFKIFSLKHFDVLKSSKLRGQSKQISERFLDFFEIWILKRNHPIFRLHIFKMLYLVLVRDQRVFHQPVGHNR